MIIRGYKEGSDITIMNTYYQFPRKVSEDSNQYTEDLLVIIYKDNETGKKHHELIYKPDYEFYMLKEEYGALDHNLFFIEKDKVDKIVCPFNNLEKVIAEKTNNMDFFKQNIANRDRQANRKLHSVPEVFFSDTSVEDHYRFKFGNEYKNSITKLNKAFFDIEVDTRWMAGNFVQAGECAINAIAFHDERSDTIISFLLRDNRNPQIAQLEEEIKSGKFGIDKIRAFIEDAIGGNKQLRRYNLDKTKVQIQFYDNELNMLRSFFDTVYKYDPDFIEGWNSSGFDLNYIIARCYALGSTPEEVMCDRSWKEKIVKHFIDQKNLSNFAERGDYTFISGDVVWMDQMIQFASRRKSKIGSFTSFKLDDIGKATAKVKKLDYSHITTDIGMLPWLDFKTFVLYNIFDVIVQKCIELKTQDLEYIFAKCLVNNTSYKKGHRQSVYLANRMGKEFYNMGYIIGNNNNRWNKEPEEKFAGALVHDPKHNNDYSKMKINGVPILMSENLQDYD